MKEEALLQALREKYEGAAVTVTQAAAAVKAELAAEPVAEGAASRVNLSFFDDLVSKQKHEVELEALAREQGHGRWPECGRRCQEYEVAVAAAEAAVAFAPTPEGKAAAEGRVRQDFRTKLAQR
jgi:hypothetical protein